MTPDERENLRNRVASRNKGRELFQTIRDLMDWDTLPPSTQSAVILAMADTLPPPPPRTPENLRASLVEAGRYRLTFGKYDGLTLTELDVLDRQYLHWLADSCRETHEAVHNFIRVQTHMAMEPPC